MNLTKIKGTKDIVGQEVLLWQKIEQEVYQLAHAFHFLEIRTPIFEFSEVFKRAIGTETDIVSKEMFELTDRGGRNMVLRPEGTAGVVRAFCENQLFLNKNQRFFYLGPMFRAERPQKGRQRQFHQIGVEIFSNPSYYADLDIINFNIQLLNILGLSQYQLKINSVGCPQCRPSYLEALKNYLAPHIQDMCAHCQTRFETNLLRVLDCKEEKCTQINNQAPSILEFLCSSCLPHFNGVKEGLETLKIPYTIDPKMVRGLDYYTKTAFEIQISSLGAQNAVCGGGRYDGLVAHFNPKQNLAGVGSAIGIERLVLALSQQENLQEKALDYYLIIDPSLNLTPFLPLLNSIREKKKSALIDSSQKNISRQLKEAHALNAKKVLIFGENEVKNNQITLKDMAQGTQETISISQFIP